MLKIKNSKTENPNLYLTEPEQKDKEMKEENNDENKQEILTIPFSNGQQVLELLNQIEEKSLYYIQNTHESEEDLEKQKMNDLESKKYNFINLSEGISMETTLCNVLTDEKNENFPKKYEKYMRKYKKNKEICIENNYFLPKLSQDKKKEKSSHTFSLSGRGYLA